MQRTELREEIRVCTGQPRRLELVRLDRCDPKLLRILQGGTRERDRAEAEAESVVVRTDDAFGCDTP